MDTQETIITRRSVRAYTPEQLTEEQLKTILEAAYSAPVAGGIYKTMQLTVVQSPEMLSKIGTVYTKEGGMKLDMLYGASTLLIISGRRDFEQAALYVNAGCILENLQLSAANMGLGSVINWATGTILPEKTDLLKELGIGSDFKPLAGIVIGYPAKEIPTRTPKVTMETNYIR